MQPRTGRLISVVDAKGQKTSYEYYPDDNLKRVSYNSVITTPPVSFTYHSSYNRIQTLIDGIGTNTYAYYAVSNTVLGAGRLQSIDGPLANDTITYTYDELGRIKRRGINSAEQQVTYDALGRVTVVTNLLGSFTNSYVSNTFRLSSVAYPNGQKTLFNYVGSTNDQRLEEIKHITS